MLEVTQISGKYDPRNVGLYNFSNRLKKLGVKLFFPKGEGVIEYSHGFAITIPQESKIPFYKTQVDFFRAIRSTKLHIVYDKILEKNGKVINGYVGESAAVEVLYALLHNKPLLFLTAPNFSQTAYSEVKEIINKRKELFEISDLDKLSDEDVLEKINETSKKQVDYHLTKEEKNVLRKSMLRLGRSYLDAWKSHKNKKL